MNNQEYHKYKDSIDYFLYHCSTEENIQKIIKLYDILSNSNKLLIYNIIHFDELNVDYILNNKILNTKYYYFSRLNHSLRKLQLTNHNLLKTNYNIIYRYDKINRLLKNEV